MKGASFQTYGLRKFEFKASIISSASVFPQDAVPGACRRNCSFLFVIQAFSYIAKICIHPTPIKSLDQLWEQASIGPVPGEVVLAVGFLFHAGLIALALLTLKGQRAVGRVEPPARHP